ncbi:MAG TPA: DinB family protein [Chitinophagaceae bacterium]|jgi:uncharacterized damage-inducible protein DinB|nr:DinB family protein [Chitinophagaceae bacterium]
MPLPTSITTRLEYQHKSLIELIEGLSDEQIRRQIIPGKWSVFENIVHLATYQHAFIQRMKRIQQEENPLLPRYTAESDPLFHDNCTKSTREIMQDLITTRRELIAKILSLKQEDVQREGTHPVFGKMNVIMWLNFFLLHEAHHLFTIFKLVPELRREIGN